MQTQYILGIDGGGSKTLARLEHLASGKRWEARGEASSLSLGVPQSVARILSLAEELAEQAGCRTQDIVALAGLAGAGNPRFCADAMAGFCGHFKHITLCSDARTSAYGANLGEPVVVVALGTGSVAMVLDNHGGERQIGGWGLLVGDQGSGARLGVNAVTTLLWELDLHGGHAESKLGKMLKSQLGQDKPTILQWLAAATPTHYAALVPMVLSLKDQCAVAGQLFAAHLQEVQRLIAASRQHDQDLPLVLTGGLAEPTITALAADKNMNLIRARGTALDGACLLARKSEDVTLNNEEAK
ncbi:ATPase [Bowmanella sp. Y26]|uniref:BadF/BadG/BcrA/BcrD ATPase family protein n=1 Tax=Bowmanella yangjiangensis TaxID=2811230 RepID=UPI001BDC3456|nr:BadF/BadG/BcrA/BcrD ATPase family protein [Bowmanella yangjiangensis]MBT1064607.1 ATPase [Bowmanella yangjiangensis]